MVVLVAGVVAGCGRDECAPGDQECEDEIFHIDGEAVYESLRRWLLIALVALLALVVLRWLVLWVRHRWYPRDTDW